MFLAAALANRREREAITALNTLQATLDAAAARLSGLLPKLEVPLPAEPAESPDYPGDREESQLNGWQLGVEWLGGRGNERTFLEGDAFTELLRSHPFYNTMRKDLTDLAREGLLNVGDSTDPGNRTLDQRINVAFSLGGVGGVKVFIQDFSTLLSGGQTGNLASTFLGSHSAAVQVIGQNPDGSYEVRIKVSNSTSLQSATRLPGIGYEDWYQDSVGEFWNQLSSTTGIGRTTEQEITWTETIMP